MRAGRWAAAALTAAVLCASAAVLGPAWADQTPSELDRQDVNAVQLPDVDGLSPGTGAQRDVTVQNATGVTGRLQIRLVDVRQRDNSCTRPERRVDPTCGTGPGQLGGELTMTVSTGRSASDVARRWSGPALRLERGANLDVTLASGTATVLDIAVSLPARAGDEIETDSFRYALSVSLHGSRGVAGETIGRHGADGRTAHGGGAGTVTIGSGGGLSSTGVPVRPILDLAAALTVIGILLLAVSRRRRRLHDR